MSGCACHCHGGPQTDEELEAYLESECCDCHYDPDSGELIPVKAGELIPRWEDCRLHEGMNDDGSSLCGHVDAEGRRTEIP